MSPLGSSALVFGGQNGEVYFNDLSAFDVNQPYDRPDGTAWETLLPNEPHPDRPLARANHTMVSWDDKLYLFGGTDGELWFSDLWQYSSSNGWTQLRGSSYFPEGRESHAAAVVDGVMFIFGGCNKEGRDLGDLHGYDFAKRRWSYFGTYHDFPSARSGHQMAVHKEKIIMVGGEPYDREDLAVMYTLSPASCFLRAELFGWSGPPWQNGQGQESKW
ncbi:Negative regulator of mitotic exit [Imshaugia aleurites]|uniref:Negative regulator of mitotic exit n=1 Tax=Imshaugia aleurites TaxID=172621 RepID=A0A8H3IWW4_9LECA|nr:Negative regulator of mitotic exit [Imshaugia aleurites]